MAGRRLTVFDDETEPLATRIAAALHKVGLAMKHQSWVQANEEGLSATQGQMLAALVANGPLTATELAQRLGLTLPTISDSASSLVEKALVSKARDPRHPRASLLTLTPRGRAVGERARSWPEYLADAADTLSRPEQEVFYAAVLKMIRALQERGQVPVSRMCITCTHFRPNVNAGPTPHHCALVDAPMADEHLRLDCAEHHAASPEERAATWRRYTSST